MCSTNVINEKSFFLVGVNCVVFWLNVTFWQTVLWTSTDAAYHASAHGLWLTVDWDVKQPLIELQAGATAAPAQWSGIGHFLPTLMVAFTPAGVSVLNSLPSTLTAAPAWPLGPTSLWSQKIYLKRLRRDCAGHAGDSSSRASVCCEGAISDYSTGCVLCFHFTQEHMLVGKTFLILHCIYIFCDTFKVELQ